MGTCRHGHDSTQPSLALWTKDVPEPEVFLILIFKEDFPQNSSCCQGKGGRFYLFSQFPLGFLELPFFLNFPLAVGVTEPATFQSLTPQATILTEFLLVLFKVPQQIGFLLGKEAW